MSVLAIDPGPAQSAYVIWDGFTIHAWGKIPNREMAAVISGAYLVETMAIEQVCSYGMAVGAEVFETVFWSGRFAEQWADERLVRIPRLKVKLHLCHSPRANDSTIRQAIIDRFGGKNAAIGKKASPGPLYGIKSDCWAALGVALTALEAGQL